MDPNLVFILGLPRSGTHLLRFALDKSPKVAFVPETAILYKYWGSRTLGRLFGRRFMGRVIARSMVTGHGDPTMAEFENREEAIATAAARTPDLAAAHTLLNAFFETPARLIGEKSPNNTLHVRDILPPNGRDERVRLVFIRRDPYDQIASSVRTSHIGGGLITALARYYVYHAALEGLDMYQVRYEDLVDEPEPALRGVCAYLGIDYSSDMLRPGVLDSSEGETFFQQGDFGFVRDSIGKGRERLDPEAVAMIDGFLDGGPSSLPLSARAGFWLRVANIEKNRLAARLGVVMLKTALKARLFGVSSVGTTGHKGEKG